MKRNLFYSILISCLLCLSAPLVLARQDASADLSELSSGSASQEDEPLTVDSVDPLKRDHSSDPQKIPGDKKVPSADSELLIDGDISFRLTHKTAKYQDQSASDQDVYSKLRLDIFSGRHNDYEFHFLGAFRKDLDENQDQTGFYPFENIVDTRKDQLHQVFEAHLDLKWLSSFSLIRLGRQAGNRGEWIYFDGAYFNWDLAEPVKLIFYGGSAVHFFEKNPGDDYLAGLGLDYHPFNHTAVNFDYLTVKDQRQNPVNEGDQKDNLFSVNLNQRFSPLTKGLVKLRWVNGEQRDLKIRAITQELPLGFELNFNYFRQFLSQSALSSETALFYDILGVSNPYQAFDFKLRQVFDKDCALDLGFYRRSLLRAEDESAFNRNFQKTFAVFELDNLMVTGLALSLSGESWSSPNYQGNAGGFELEYGADRIKRSLRVSAGSYYSLYKYDYYLDYGERTKVRTYFVKTRIPLGENYSLTGSFETEDQIEEYQILKMGVKRDF